MERGKGRRATGSGVIASLDMGVGERRDSRIYLVSGCGRWRHSGSIFSPSWELPKKNSTGR